MNYYDTQNFQIIVKLVLSMLKILITNKLVTVIMADNVAEYNS